MAWHRIALGLTLAVSLLLTLTGLAQEAPLENTAGTVETTGEETIPALDDPAPPAQTAGPAVRSYFPITLTIQPRAVCPARRLTPRSTCGATSTGSTSSQRWIRPGIGHRPP